MTTKIDPKIEDKTPPISEMLEYLKNYDTRRFGFKPEILGLRLFYEMTGRLSKAQKDKLIMNYVVAKHYEK